MARPMHTQALAAEQAVLDAVHTDVPAARVTTTEPMRGLAVLADERRRLGARASGAQAPGAWRGQAARAAAFVVLGVAVVSLVPGTGSLPHLTSWWAHPVAYQRFALWGLLWELAGLGGGAVVTAPRSLRAPLALTHWLRPGTVRLPPWPGRVLATAGTRRDRVDVGLYAVAVLLTVVLLLGPAGADGLPGAPVWALVAVLTLLGLRDKVAFLATRPDVYLPLLLVAAFPPVDTVAAAQLCLAGWWWGRGLAALTPGFGSAVALRAGDAPWTRRLSAAMWSGPAHTPVPSTAARLGAGGWAATQLLLPVVLLACDGGPVTVVAVTVMVAVQLAGMSSLPVGAAVETDLFLFFSTLALFGAGADAPGLHSAALGLLLGVVLAGRVLLGLLAPRLISPVMSLRRHSGDEASALWLVRDDAEVPGLPPAGREVCDRQLAARALLPRTGALLGLLERAVDDPRRYRIVDSELVAGGLLGWSFGDGRLAGTALLDHLRAEVHLEPGQLRLLSLAAQGPGRRSHYRVTDAASGKVEEGTVDRADARAHRPFDATCAALPVVATFHVLPPVTAPVIGDPPPRHASPGSRGPSSSGDSGDSGDEPVRLGADGVTGRHRPRPSLDR